MKSVIYILLVIVFFNIASFSLYYLGVLNRYSLIFYDNNVINVIITNILLILLLMIYVVIYKRYLIDKFNVSLILNEEYNQYNNTSSIIRVIDKLEDTYICSSDNYFPKNVFIEITNELIDKKINSFIEADRDKKVDKNDERILTKKEIKK